MSLIVAPALDGPLPKRWTELRHHPEQDRWWTSTTRFNTVPAGRRSGKTEIGKRRIVKKAMRGSRFDDPRYFVGAPTYAQAKRIYWKDLKKLVPKWAMNGPPSETDLIIFLRNGAEIHVVGLDKPERIEGSPWDWGLLDEYGNMKPGAWTENVRPALSDRQGGCDLIGVPEGRNHYYETHKRAIAEYAEKGELSEWGAFHWLSADVLPPEEIEAARRDLDELTFQQEYEASFVSFEGRAYYVFDERTHCVALKYDPKQPLLLMFDFNVAPGVCAIAQEQRLPNQYFRDKNGVMDLARPVTGTGIIGEVFIERNSNTPAVCRAILKDKNGNPSKWSKHIGRVVCFGDATGGNSGSKAIAGSDWDLVKAELRPVFGERLEIDVPKSNPPERSRVNATNSRLLSADKTVRMMVDPAAAPHVVKDFEGVVLLKGGSGEIDKVKTPELTHLSDGIGYYIWRRHALGGNELTRISLSGV